MGEFQRWNTHHSHVVPIEVCGHQLNIAQDPSSDNLGTTIWDASVILVRYMERNPQLYSRRKLEGKTVLELGAGCGLAGMFFALQGAHVTFTDLAEVVPLLRRNVSMNLGGQARALPSSNDEGGEQGHIAKANVMEYCWGMPLDGLKPPYDYVVACDCVYVERLVDALVSSMVNVSGHRTTVLVASEKREEITYAKFRERLAEDFTVRQAPRRHMDKAFDHENSEVLLCKLRRSGTNCSKVEKAGEEEGTSRPNANVLSPREAADAGLRGGTGEKIIGGEVGMSVTTTEEELAPETTKMTAEGVELAGLGQKDVNKAAVCDKVAPVTREEDQSASMQTSPRQSQSSSVLLKTSAEKHLIPGRHKELAVGVDISLNRLSLDEGLVNHQDGAVSSVDNVGR